MPIDTRFSIALAIMAVVAFGCRVAGLIVGTHLGDNPGLRRFWTSYLRVRWVPFWGRRLP